MMASELDLAVKSILPRGDAHDDAPYAVYSVSNERSTLARSFGCFDRSGGKSNIFVVAPKSFEADRETKRCPGLPVPPKADSPELGQAMRSSLPPPPHYDDNHYSDDVIDAIVNELIADLATGIVFDIHRSIKMGYFSTYEDIPDESQQEYKIVKDPNTDIFGQQLGSLSKQIAEIFCSCPVCKRSICASRFAPHLEKCMGMGRTSSRLASRRIAASNTLSSGDKAAANSLDVDNSDDSDNDANDLDWVSSSGSKHKRMGGSSSKKQRLVTGSRDSYTTTMGCKIGGGNRLKGSPAARNLSKRAIKRPPSASSSSRSSQATAENGFFSYSTRQHASKDHRDSNSPGALLLGELYEVSASSPAAPMLHSSASELFRDLSLFNSEDTITPPATPLIVSSIPAIHCEPAVITVYNDDVEDIITSGGSDASSVLLPGRLTRNSSSKVKLTSLLE